MAIIRCPECSKDVSDQAANCPHCGVSIKDKPRSGCFPAIGIGLVSIIIIVATFDSGKSKTPATPESTVRGLCMFDIKAQLGDPGSADFEHSSSTITSKSGDTWTVIRPVRAKNAFNATVKNTFQCRYKQTGDKYALIDVQKID